MTSCGHTITQPAHPVHRPLSMTSSHNSFHCAVHRSRVGAGASSVTVITRHHMSPHASVESVNLASDFERDGYVHLPGIIPQDLVDRAVAELESAYGSQNGAEPNRVTDLWELGGPAREIAGHRPVLDVLELLYGRSPIPFQTLTFTRGTEQRGHADAIHFNSLPARFMSGVWVAFEDISPDSGALFYYAGSQALPELAPHDLGRSPADFDYSAYE